jgi:DNA-binding NarL/FixJ family response regulator
MNEPEKISIILADDHGLFRSGIKEILNSFEDIVLLGEAENGMQLISMYKKNKANVLLVDISMPKMSGIEAIKEIKEYDSRVKSLFLSMYDAEEYVYAVLMAGGYGLINKNINKNELNEAIHKVYNGEKYFKDYTDEKLEKIMHKFDSSKSVFSGDYHELTNREKKILKYISKRMTSAEIAEKLKLSKRTVDTHRAALIAKLNLKSLPELIKFAIQYTTITK